MAAVSAIKVTDCSTNSISSFSITNRKCTTTKGTTLPRGARVTWVTGPGRGLANPCHSRSPSTHQIPSAFSHHSHTTHSLTSTIFLIAGQHLRQTWWRKGTANNSLASEAIHVTPTRRYSTYPDLNLEPVCWRPRVTTTVLIWAGFFGSINKQ